ncbi:MAG TPA: response regulator transcription factor [Chloroflexota bacterium]|nr:response regulator transcription factor [Chloroflexota bacterium]
MTTTHPAQEEHSGVVLLVMPERHAATMIGDALAFHGRRTEQVGSGAAALAWVQQGGAALIILDMNQPDTDGLVLCSDLRARTSAPIIVCGDREQKREALLAFRLGADDFVAKPFDVDDLMARAISLLRRTGAAQAPRRFGRTQTTSHRMTEASPPEESTRVVGIAGTEPAPRGATTARPAQVGASEMGSEASGTPIASNRSMPGGADGSSDARENLETVGDLTLDRTHHRVTLGDQEVRLSRSEYLLLGAMMGRPDELLSRLELARAVWGPQLAGIGRPIDQHIYRLRNKLQRTADEHGLSPPAIVAVPGFGYKLVTTSEALAQAS